MVKHKEHAIHYNDAVTLDGLFRIRSLRTPDTVAYRYFDKTSGEWHDSTWQEMAVEVARWQKGLASLNLDPGDRVALSLKNCREWVMFEQAALGLGLVVVPLYTDDRPDNISFIVDDAGIKLLLLEDVRRWKQLAPALQGRPSLQSVILLKGECNELLDEDERLVCADNLLPLGDHTLQAIPDNPHALATIVYTSGTTGRPKGVMLSHLNILSIAYSATTLGDFLAEDIYLSFLPLSHTLERTGGYYLPMVVGATVAYSRSITQLAEDLQVIKPTVLMSVPRIYERIYNRITSQLEKGPVYRRWLFHAAVAVGWHQFEREQGRRHWHPKLLFQPLLRRLVAEKIIQRMGGRLRFAISGGAALSPNIAQTFLGLGIPILQGYGLTETSPMISVNLPEDNDPASVGVLFTGVEVRIGADHEVQVHSPGIMLGYWNNHKATAEMIGRDGWLNTGDQGYMKNNHLYINGRIKDILVLSNGEKVPPADMEMAIILDPLFDQVMVIGEGRSWLAALIVLNQEQWPNFALEHNVDPEDGSSLSNKQIITAVMRRITTQLHNFPGYAKIRRVHLFLEPWTVDNELLTPTLKVKRSVVMKRFKNEIEQLYQSGR